MEFCSAEYDGELRVFLVRLIALGYQVRVCILNAAFYGDPQSRARVFIFAMQRGFSLPQPPPPTHGCHGFSPKTPGCVRGFLEAAAIHPSGCGMEVRPATGDANLRPVHTMADALSDLAAPTLCLSPEVKDERVAYSNRRPTTFQQQLRRNMVGPRAAGPLHHVLRRTSRLQQKPAWTAPANTVCCTLKMAHPQRPNSALSSRERMRLMSLPDDFELPLPGSLGQGHWTFPRYLAAVDRCTGNAVPIALGRAVAGQFWRAVHAHDSRHPTAPAARSNGGAGRRRPRAPARGGAGCGCADDDVDREGFWPSCAIEQDAMAAAAFRRNMPSALVYQGTIDAIFGRMIQRFGALVNAPMVLVD